jgi:chromosome segregation ATPase
MKTSDYMKDENAAQAMDDWQADMLANAGEEISRLRAKLTEAEAEVKRLVDQRDLAEDWADKLAYAVGSVEEIGEYSNMNNPWAKAYELIDAKLARIRELAAERDALKLALESLQLKYLDTKGESNDAR